MKTLVSFFLFLLCLFVCAESAIGQYVWTKNAQNPIFSGSGNGTWDKHVFGPMVLFNSDSARYEMWYTGSYGPEISWRPYRIGLVYSPDGVTWTRRSNNPVLSPTTGTWDELSVEFPAVIRENGQYKMWYTGLGTNGSHVGYATSPDGINWTKHSTPVLGAGTSSWESGGVSSCLVVLSSGRYKMLYTGTDASVTRRKIGLATSIDGINWVKDTLNNPVFVPGTPGAWDDWNVFATGALELNNTFYLWYLGVRNPETTRMIGLATSTNGGITWTRHAANPVLVPGSSGSWDANYAESGSVLLRQGTIFDMWYDGSRSPTGTYLWRIGHATSPRVGTVRRVPSQYATIQSAINASVHGDTVLVSDGTYYENIRFNGKKIVVASTFITTNDTSHISRTIINGSFGLHADSGSVVYFTSGEDTNSVLCGFTITGGTGTIDRVTFPPYTPRYGGGVLCDAGARIVHNCIEGNSISHPTHGAGGTGIWCSLNDGAYLIIESNRINNNTATTAGQSGGGGIGCAAATWKNMTVRIENNKILNNTMTSTAAGTQNNCLGGGLIIQYGNFVVTKNLISGNTASSLSTGDINVGGGMHAYGCSVQFRENIVTGNQVQGPSNISSYAGGVSFWAAEVQRQTLVVNNIISSNKAIGGNLGGGGGIMAFDEAARIENNIIVKNTAYLAGGVGCARVYLAASEKPADDGGGAVFGRISEQGHHSSLYTPSMVVAPPTLINNTIAYNKATSGSGGGIATRGSWIPKVINSIVWGDTASNEIYIQSGSIRVLYSNVTNGWPSDSGNISVNPQFADGTYRLANTSGCLQKGIDSVQIDGAWYHAPPFCTYGMPRPSPAGTRPDIGACENPTLVDGVDEPVNGLPKTFALEQNYPNPFNPTTTIKYQIPNSNRQMGFGVSYLGFVSLKVFDILGREVATLVNEVQGAGFKSVQWDASGVASGVYLYRLQAGGFVETKKCLVLR